MLVPFVEDDHYSADVIGRMEADKCLHSAMTEANKAAPLALGLHITENKLALKTKWIKFGNSLKVTW